MPFSPPAWQGSRSICATCGRPTFACWTQPRGPARRVRRAPYSRSKGRRSDKRLHPSHVVPSGSTPRPISLNCCRVRQRQLPWIPLRRLRRPATISTTASCPSSAAQTRCRRTSFPRHCWDSRTMDFSHSDERQMLLAMLERYRQERYPFKVRQAAAYGAVGFDRERWVELGELGVVASLFSAASGGSGGDGIDITDLVEWLERALAVK